jgi:YesN/AraC family two-component response regulator
MDSDQVMKISIIISQYINTHQPYLRPGYTLKDLALDTELPLHHVSAFINQYYGMHFNDFINRYRVRHFKERIENEAWKAKKLEAIAEESGFNNRNTFAIAFKKVYGLKPSEYMKKVQLINGVKEYANK